MSRSNVTDRLSHDLGNLNADYHKAECGDGIYMKLEHCKTGESFRSLDFCGGAAVACLGNGGENASAEYVRVADAAAAQMKKLAYVSHTSYRSDVNFDLSELLVRNANRYLVLDEETHQWQYKDIEADESSKLSHAIILNSGKLFSSFCVEHLVNSLKVPRPLRRRSRQFGSTGEHKESRTKKRSYHEKAHTMATDANGMRIGLWQSSNQYYPHGDKIENETEEEYVDRLLRNLKMQIMLHGADTIAAIWIEPVSGAGLGCQPAGPGYLKEIKKLCRNNDIILVYDEVMCGMGRMGSMHAWHYDQAQLCAQLEGDSDASDKTHHLGRQGQCLQSLAPDIQMMGKCLGAGIMPAAGLIVNRRVADGLAPKFIHSFTYQAHPTVCAAALSAQREIQILLEAGKIQKLAKCLEREIKEKLYPLGNVADIRGRGLFWGIELQHDDGGAWAHDVSMELVAFGEDDHFIQEDACIRFYGSGWRLRKHGEPERKGDHIMLSPAFTFTERDIIEGVSRLANVVQRYFGESAYISRHRAKDAKGAFVP
ncbi:uncharacterized protein JN550_013489 [Neoarthrinium moseri]|uniref:uncharacterized protein n=1 Tax=Neoarthrinium moseri TaxID=1658444 RepID=UPI001FDDD84F|nr:uncharacterized protein JN550_013489 [Neoarthrinium moseri]KAI1856996.1 hypothetical protein JN550_013489 [Neoarthrinium moseri]